MHACMRERSDKETERWKREWKWKPGKMSLNGGCGEPKPLVDKFAK